MSKNKKKTGILHIIKKQSIMTQIIIYIGAALVVLGMLLFIMSVVPIGRISYVYLEYEYSFYEYNLWKYWYLLVPALALIALEAGIFVFLINAEPKERKVYLIYLIVLDALLLGVMIAMNLVIDEAGSVHAIVRILVGLITLISIGLLCITSIELVAVAKKVAQIKEYEKNHPVDIPTVQDEKINNTDGE